VPLLHALNRKVQYFPFSRLQLGDRLTKEQILREIPPGAVIIDSGLEGTIIDSMRGVDPSFSGSLMASTRHYPQLLAGDAQNTVKLIEAQEKILDRSKAFNTKGNAISRIGGPPDEYGKFSKYNRWVTERENRVLLAAMGLPQSYAIFARYSGLTPQQRLLLNSEDAVFAHYNIVAQSRATGK
jgi:hypothetical protein